TWSQSQLVSAPNSASFGFSVAIQGDTAMVGEPEDATSNGLAFVFTRSGTVWSKSATLRPTAQKFLGASVALDGDTAIVGSPYDSGKQGSAYVFARSGTTWTQQGQLLAPDLVAGDQAGWSVAIRGDNAVIGAPFRQSNTGAAYSFQRAGGSWAYTSMMVALDPTTNSELGYAIAMRSDGTTLIGSYGAGLGASLDGGAVYVFVPAAGYGATCSAGADCASADCVDGVCCSTSACDTCGTCSGASPGTCTPKPLGAAPTTTCGEFACDGSTMSCLKSCAGNGECIAGAVCDSTTNTCIQGASCSADHSTSTDRSGVLTPCTTYLCDPGTGLCGTACILNTDCAAGYSCDSHGICGAIVAPASNASACGCVVGARSSGDVLGASAVFLALVAARKVRRRLDLMKRNACPRHPMRSDGPRRSIDTKIGSNP
ncbi:MAG: hypothetical protein ACHREM_21900, partial [Polyangiales bacterium]